MSRKGSALIAATVAMAFACSKPDANDVAKPNAAPGAPSTTTPAAPPVPSAAMGEPTQPSKPSGPPGPLNVILISIDCLRQDMPWAGYDKPIAPNLTKLAAESAVYTHMYSVSARR